MGICEYDMYINFISQYTKLLQFYMILYEDLHEHDMHNTKMNWIKITNNLDYSIFDYNKHFASKTPKMTLTFIGKFSKEKKTLFLFLTYEKS